MDQYPKEPHLFTHTSKETHQDRCLLLQQEGGHDHLEDFVQTALHDTQDISSLLCTIRESEDTASPVPGDRLPSPDPQVFPLVSHVNCWLLHPPFLTITRHLCEASTIQTNKPGESNEENTRRGHQTQSTNPGGECRHLFKACPMKA